MKLGDTKRIGGATLEITEFCDEPNTGLLIVEHSRDDHDSSWNFAIPCEWWDALRCDSQDLLFHHQRGPGPGPWRSWDQWAKACEKIDRPEVPRLRQSPRSCPIPGPLELRGDPVFDGGLDSAHEHPIGWWLDVELGPDELDEDGP